MHRPISIPISNAVIISVLISCVQIFSKWGTVHDEVSDPPCNLIWDLLLCRALRIWQWLWGQFSPYQSSVDPAQYYADCYRCDEYACEYVYQVHIKYICYGCSWWSCCNNWSIVCCICCCMCSISSYTTERWSGFTYSNCSSNSHILMYSICNCSFNSNTANVLECRAYATVVSVMYMNNTRISIRLFNGQATRFANLGIVPFYRVVHFFYMGGILSLPYQFYHHRVKITSRPAWWKKFSFRYPPPPFRLSLSVLHCAPPF